MRCGDRWVLLAFLGSATAAVWESGASPTHLQISGLPANASGSTECDLLQLEFLWLRPSLWSDGAACEIAVFSDSSCSQLVESASTPYDSAVLQRRVMLAAGGLELWIPAHRRANCFRMRLPSAFFPSSKALLSSITLLEGESYDASFVPRRSSSELVFFRGFGPRLEAWAAAVALGLVLAVLAMIHAAGVPQGHGFRKSVVKRDDFTSGSDEAVSCEALLDFGLGISISLEFCLMVLYVVTHIFASQATMLAALLVLLAPMLFVPLPGRPSPEPQPSNPYHARARALARRMDHWRPQRRGSLASSASAFSGASASLVACCMAPVFCGLCMVYHCQVLMFHLSGCTAACRRRLSSCSCSCSALAKMVLASMAAISRALVSPPIFCAVTKREQKEAAAFGKSFMKRICLCCSVPILLIMLVDMVLQPEMGAYEGDESAEIVSGSLIACAVLLIVRQVLLFCIRISPGEEEEEVDAEHGGLGAEDAVPESSEAKVPCPEPPDEGMPSDCIQEQIDLQLHPEPPRWNSLPAPPAAEIQAPVQQPWQTLPPSVEANQVLPPHPTWSIPLTTAAQVPTQPPLSWPAAVERDPIAPWHVEDPQQVRKSVSRETDSGSGLNQAVMRRLSRISQHFLGAKASSGEWADSATEVPRSSFFKEKKKKRKKKEKPLETE